MRQAAATVTVCLCFVLASPARGGDGAIASAGTIARSRRLIDAKDYAAATTLLEDLLLECGAQERPVILGILRQSYEVMARQAEAAGRDRDAAHYRDNLAILSASPPAREPARPAGPRAKRREEPRSAAVPTNAPGQKPEDRPQPADPKTSIAAPKQPASALLLEEPVAVSEPPVVPKAESTPTPVAEPLAERPSAGILDQQTDTPARNKTRPQAADTAPGSFALATPPRSRGPNTAAAGSSSQAPGEVQAPDGARVSEADRLFSAKQYNEAGQCYAALARENRLPANRTNHWAYCRIVGVATRMNALPKTTREWDEIEAEIQSIQRLAPNLWYGEYLRRRLAEVRNGRSRTKAKNDGLVVRGSAPEESLEKPRRFPRLFGKSRADAPSKADPVAPAASVANEAETAGTQRPLTLAANPSQGQSSQSELDSVNGGKIAADAPAPIPADLSAGSNEAEVASESASTTRSGEWQVRDTPNFRIFHADARLAESVGESAESVRAAQAKRWGSSALQRAWAPRCEIYLYPDGKAFAAATSQPETSPGFSVMESDGKQITTRKVHLRADQSRLLTAVLPHEVTHVVVADLFVVHQIPRWADEGIAVLAEPESEQGLRAADLRESLSAGEVFDLRQLMSNDTPEAKHWSLYYAQSVSITRFLVERGKPEQLIQFLRESGRTGIEAALRDIYRIGGFADLQERWQDYAREQLASTK